MKGCTLRGRGWTHAIWLPVLEILPSKRRLICLFPRKCCSKFLGVLDGLLIHAPTSIFQYSVGGCGADLSESKLHLDSDPQVEFEFLSVQTLDRGACGVE